MSESLTCPHCGKTCNWTTQRAGHRVRCVCNLLFWIPDTPDGRVKRDGGYISRHQASANPRSRADVQRPAALQAPPTATNPFFGAFSNPLSTPSIGDQMAA